MDIHIKIDDLSDPRIAAFLEGHLADMYATSPPESVHALDLDELRRPEITFWSAWHDDTLLGCAALIARDKRATLLFWISFVAVIVFFGYAFAATDLIAHKGLGQVLPFPLFIAAVSAFSIWLARFAARKGWLSGQ